MKWTAFLLVLVASASNAQSDSTVQPKTKSGIIQVGYVREIVDDGGAGLTGAEAQYKVFFKRQQLKPGEKLSDAFYFQAGYAFFGGDGYTLGQASAGLGALFPVLQQRVQCDFGASANYYQGKLAGKSWKGQTIDLGFHFGVGVPVHGPVTGIYARLNMPAAISTLANEDVVSAMLLSVGIQF